MKSLIAVVLIMFAFTLIVKPQSYRGTPPQKSIKPTFSTPLLRDSVKLKSDIKNVHVLRKIYTALKKKNVGIVYQYAFIIDENGHIIVGMKEDRSSLSELNKYIETVFKNYTWIPSYKLNCETCFVQRLADFSVIFNTTEKYISCSITVNGTRGKVFYEKISMN